MTIIHPKDIYHLHIPIGSMGLVYLPTCGWFVWVNVDIPYMFPIGIICSHPGRWTHGTYSHLLWKERKMIWTKPPQNYVPAVNLQGCILSQKNGPPLAAKTGLKNLPIRSRSDRSSQLHDAHGRCDLGLHSGLWSRTGEGELKTRWWFQIFLFPSLPGEDSHFD